MVKMRIYKLLYEIVQNAVRRVRTEIFLKP